MDVKLDLHANDRFQSKEQNQKIISVHKVPLRMQQSKASADHTSSKIFGRAEPKNGPEIKLENKTTLKVLVRMK